MHLRKIVVPALVLMLGAMGAQRVRAEGAAPAQGYGQGQGRWDVPPRELNSIQQQGYRDGIEGARKDYDNHRQPNVENRDEYRHPSVRGAQREAYRDGFRRGYSRAMDHLMGGMRGPGMAPPPMPRGDWNAVPREFNDIQQRGFRDGMEGARKDFDNHRRPDVMNRDEYRHPNVPPAMRDAYRQGFQRGYDRAEAHLNGRQWQY